MNKSHCLQLAILLIAISLLPTVQSSTLNYSSGNWHDWSSAMLYSDKPVFTSITASMQKTVSGTFGYGQLGCFVIIVNTANGQFLELGIMGNKEAFYASVGKYEHTQINFKNIAEGSFHTFAIQKTTDRWNFIFDEEIVHTVKDPSSATEVEISEETISHEKETVDFDAGTAQISNAYVTINDKTYPFTSPPFGINLKVFNNDADNNKCYVISPTSLMLGYELEIENSQFTINTDNTLYLSILVISSGAILTIMLLRKKR